MNENDFKNNITNYANDNTFENISKTNNENKKSTLYKSEEDENLNNNYKRIDNNNYGEQTNEISNNNNVTDTFNLNKRIKENINIEKEKYNKGMNNKGINKEINNVYANSNNTNDIISDNVIITSKNENNQQPVDLFEEEPVLRTQGRKLKNTSSNSDNNYSKESKKDIEPPQNKEIEQPKEVKEDNTEKEEQKKEDKNEAYEDGEKIRKKIKLMDRLNKARARSCGKKDEKAKKSNDILMKAKLLESVLGNLKKPEDLNNNKNNDVEKESIKQDNVGINNRDHSCDVHIIQKKKKKKNNIPFDG